MPAFILCTEFTRSRSSLGLWGLEAWDEAVDSYWQALWSAYSLPLSFSFPMREMGIASSS